MTTEKTAIVTGGGSGIGAAISNALRSKGYHVVIGQRNKPQVEGFRWIQTDVSIESDCHRLVDQTTSEYGQLDVLVNNAGLMLEASLDTMSREHWDQTMAVNLRAPFVLTQQAMPWLQKTRGNILNIGSIEGLACNPNHSAYSVSKAALHALTRATAVDHGTEVRCNAIAPGWIDTELNTNFIESMPNPERFRDRIGKIHPTGRTGSPEEVAKLALFLCSDDAAFINGQTLTIDGGRTIQLPLPD